MLHNFNVDGFDSVRPKYAGGRPPKIDTTQREAIKKIALARPVDHGLPFSTWSLSKLADYRVAQGWSRTSLTKGSGSCCVMRASPFQAVKTWKTSTDPDYEAKKNPGAGARCDRRPQAPARSRRSGGSAMLARVMPGPLG